MDLKKTKNMKQFLLEVASTYDVDSIKNDSTIWLYGDMGKRIGKVVLTEKGLPNSSFIHVKMNENVPSYFLDGGVNLQLENMHTIPILSIKILK